MAVEEVQTVSAAGADAGVQEQQTVSGAGGGAAVREDATGAGGIAAGGVRTEQERLVCGAELPAGEADRVESFEEDHGAVHVGASE